MVDTKLIADALRKSPRQQHLVSSHCTCYQGYMTRYKENYSDLDAKINAEYHERVLRSFLVTGCVRTSERLVMGSFRDD